MTVKYGYSLSFIPAGFLLPSLSILDLVLECQQSFCFRFLFLSKSKQNNIKNPVGGYTRTMHFHTGGKYSGLKCLLLGWFLFGFFVILNGQYNSYFPLRGISQRKGGGWCGLSLKELAFSVQNFQSKNVGGLWSDEDIAKF